MLKRRIYKEDNVNKKQKNFKYNINDLDIINNLEKASMFYFCYTNEIITDFVKDIDF